MPSFPLNSLAGASRLVRYPIAAAAAALTTLITVSFPALQSTPFLLPFCAVVLCAWILAFDGALVCAVTSSLLLDYFFFPPQLAFSFKSRYEMTRMGVFLVVSAIFSLIAKTLVKYRDGLLMREMSNRIEVAEARRDKALEAERAAITAREGEERLRLALDSAEAGMWDWNLVTGELKWSGAHYAIFGLDPEKVTVNYGLWRSSVLPDDLANTEAAIASAQRDHRDFHHEFRIRRTDGVVRWIEAHGRFQYDAEGQAVRMAGVVRDRTRERQAADALLRSEKLAITGRLAASIAHEINNPLESVMNLLYLIRASDSLAQVHAHSELALTELVRVAQITQQTLRFYRQSEGPKVLRLSEILDSVLVLCQARITTAAIKVERRYGEDPPFECLDGDLRQIFANLIGNAIDAMRDGGTLTIRVRRSNDWRDANISGLRVAIGDTGTGMDARTRRRIYEPFFTTKAERGTGLGMWVVAELVRRNRGDLRVWSSTQPGRRGTTFSLFLPGKIAETAASVTRRAIPDRRAAQSGPAAGVSL